MDLNPYEPPASNAPSQPLGAKASGRANLSLILGALANIAFCLPPLCLILALASIILGVLGWHSPQRVNAGLGIGFSVVALVLTAGVVAFTLAFAQSFPKPYQ